jgi:hypothetical protein
MMQPVEGVSAFPNGDNIFDWAATIEGSAGTVRSFPQPECAAARCALCAVRPVLAQQRLTRRAGAHAGVRELVLQAVSVVLRQVPVRGPDCEVRHCMFPPERRHCRQHLPGHPEGTQHPL